MDSRLLRNRVIPRKGGGREGNLSTVGFCSTLALQDVLHCMPAPMCGMHARLFATPRKDPEQGLLCCGWAGAVYRRVVQAARGHRPASSGRCVLQHVRQAACALELYHLEKTLSVVYHGMTFHPPQPDKRAYKRPRLREADICSADGAIPEIFIYTLGVV